jgi:peptidoglycan/xylan/chitin deacetylase (PgdA/CDA1 family)
MSALTPLSYAVRNGAYRALAPLARRLYRRPVWILMYHSVGTNGFDFTVTPDDFRAQLHCCRERFDIVPLARAAALAGGEPLPGERPAVALTFDDCYADNLDHALPLLRDTGAPATFYAATNHVGARMQTRYGSLPVMTWGDLQSLVKAGFAVGAHSVTHQPLTTLDAAARDREVRDSKKLIEDKIGQPVASFAYPFGVYDAGCVEPVRRAGFANAVTAREGMVRAGISPFELPRVPILRWADRAVFGAMLDGAVEMWERLRGR